MLLTSCRLPFSYLLVRRHLATGEGILRLLLNGQDRDNQLHDDDDDDDDQQLKKKTKQLPEEKTNNFLDIM